MLGTGQDGGKCCGKAIGEVDPSTLGKTTSLKINDCLRTFPSTMALCQLQLCGRVEAHVVAINKFAVACNSFLDVDKQH